MTKHHEAIFDKPIPHGSQGSLPSLISNDDFGDNYQHISTEQASSSSTQLLIDDS
jgi:hypothetical protein